MDKKTYDEIYDDIGAQMDALPLPDNEEERQAYCRAWCTIIEQGGWTMEEWEVESERRVGLLLERLRLHRDSAINQDQLDKRIDLD